MARSWCGQLYLGRGFYNPGVKPFAVFDIEPLECKISISIDKVEEDCSAIGKIDGVLRASNERNISFVRISVGKTQAVRVGCCAEEIEFVG